MATVNADGGTGITQGYGRRNAEPQADTAVQVWANAEASVWASGSGSVRPGGWVRLGWLGRRRLGFRPRWDRNRRFAR
jgi:hypothetical protein